MGNKKLYIGIGAVIGLVVGIVPTIREIGNGTNGTNGADPKIYLTTFFGPIIVGGAIGYSLA